MVQVKNSEGVIKINELKKELREMDQKQLIQLIVDLYKANKDVKQFLSTKFIGEEAVEVLFEQTKQRIKNEFFPDRGNGKLRLAEAKKAITDFKKLADDRMRIVDLMLFYVEMGTDFTDSYGAIDEKFYNSMVSMFEKVVSECEDDETLYKVFKERLYNVVEGGGGIGWGFGDEIADLYYQLYYSFEDEEE
ncbi:DUF6155 family protein [Bacillus dakarensis]|uniref:DUF6155 family protein n=1 Tax=Robertmurraya dakarensis TaxID=1926278 RepID=UPI0009816E39|nr:DUF6155 family protein [Bacillus dakarensis]